MNKITRSISAILLSLILMLASSLIYVNAAEDELVLDGKISYKVGDTVTYDLCLQTPEGVVGVQMYVYYDPSYLSIKADSVESPGFKAATINPKLDGEIILIWSNAADPADFTEKEKMLTAEFEVLKEGKTNITYGIQEMYPIDLTYLKEQTITVDYSSNGTIVKEDNTPIVDTNPDHIDEFQGQFPNYEDGKGENNPNVEDERTIVTSPNKVNEPANNNVDNNANVATNAQGQALETDAAGNYLDENGNKLSTDANGNYVDKDGNIYQSNSTGTSQNNTDIVPIVIIIAVVLAAIAIVVIIVLRSRGGDDKYKHSEKSAGQTDDDNDSEE